MLTRPVVLVGLMGVGKTSIGMAAAKILNAPFVDSDHEIEKSQQCSIAEVFDQYGEGYFRALERQTLEKLCTQRPAALIAAGGGAFQVQTTRELLREKALCVWLDYDLEQLIARLERDAGNRPLLKGQSIRERVLTLAAERTPFYQQAHLKCTFLQHHVASNAAILVECLRTHCPDAFNPHP